MTPQRHRVTNLATARSAVQELLDSLAGFATRVRPVAIRPITEREYLSRVLDFASWDGDVQRLGELEQRLLFGGDLTDRQGKPIENATLAVRTASESAEFFRDMFRRHLAELAKHGASRFDFNQHIYLNMIILPARLDAVKARESLAVFLPRNLHIAVDFALALLNDGSRPFGNALRKCELPTCGGYFLLERSPKGGKPAKYHDDCRARLRAKSRHLKRQSKES